MNTPDYVSYMPRMERKLNRVEFKLDMLNLFVQEIAKWIMSDDQEAMNAALKKMHKSTAKLQAEMEQESPRPSFSTEDTAMANQNVDAWIADIKATTGVLESATKFIKDEVVRMEAAVAAALEGGATKEELAPVQAEVDLMKAKRDEMAAAIATP